VVSPFMSARRVANSIGSIATVEIAIAPLVNTKRLGCGYKNR